MVELKGILYRKFKELRKGRKKEQKNIKKVKKDRGFKKLIAERLKLPYVSISAFYLVFSLIVPWLNSLVYVFLSKNQWLANISILIGYLLISVMMVLINRFIPNKKSFKLKISDEFLSFNSLFKSAIIYIIAIAFLAEKQTFGIVLLIPYYMYVINFYTAVSGGKIKQGWF